MKMATINTSFSTSSDASFEVFSRHIVASMTGNSYFVTCSPALPVVEAAVTRYSAALLGAKDLGKNNIAEKNDSRAYLEQVLRLLALYVMNIAGGSIPMLTSSGFVLSKDRENQYLDTNDTPILTNGITSGSMICQLPNVKYSKGFNHQLATELPTEATVWQNNLCTTSKFTFNNLTPGKQYWVRVMVTGSRQQSAYSPVASIFVQ